MNMSYHSAAMGCISLLLVCFLLAGCAGSSSQPSRTGISSDPGSFIEPSQQKAIDATPDSVAREISTLACKANPESPACVYTRQFAQGTFPDVPLGRTVSVGKSILLGGKQGNTSEQRFLISWLYRDEADRLMVRFFDPTPENADETADIQSYIASLETGTALPADNHFKRYMDRVSRSIKLFPAIRMDNALAFKGSETRRMNRTGQQVVYFMRETEGSLYVVFLHVQQDLTTRVGIAQLPKPASRH